LPNRRVGLLALYLTCGAYLAFADKDPVSPKWLPPLDDGTGSGPATTVSAPPNRVRTIPVADDLSTQADCR
jgi:hypothetical protein